MRYHVLVEQFVIKGLGQILVAQSDDKDEAERTVSDLTYMVNHQTKVILRDTHQGCDTSSFAHHFPSARL